MKEEFEVTAGAMERNKRVLKKDLELNKHYRGVNHEVWRLLHKIYGGGPVVVREVLDIYSPDMYTHYNAVVKKEKYKKLLAQHKAQGQEKEINVVVDMKNVAK